MGMSFFDAICHSFTTMATGGFSTYNASLGHFETLAATHGGAIETTVILFMILAGTNFTLLALMVMGQPWKLFADIEFRTYLSILLLATTVRLPFRLPFSVVLLLLASRTIARISSCFLMECQPVMPRFLAIWARSLSVYSFKPAVVIKTQTSES